MYLVMNLYITRWPLYDPVTSLLLFFVDKVCVVTSKSSYTLWTTAYFVVSLKVIFAVDVVAAAVALLHLFTGAEAVGMLSPNGHFPQIGLLRKHPWQTSDVLPMTRLLENVHFIDMWNSGMWQEWTMLTKLNLYTTRNLLLEITNDLLITI
jgi:hypothetical protein